MVVRACRKDLEIDDLMAARKERVYLVLTGRVLLERPLRLVLRGLHFGVKKINKAFY